MTAPEIPPTFPSSPVKVPIPTAGPSPYEFSYADNSTIGNLGSKMSFVGLFMVGIGIFFSAFVILRWKQELRLEVSLLFFTLLFIVIGIWTNAAGREFRSVSRTVGKDIPHLMKALENLLKLYTLVYLLFFITLIFAIIQLAAHSLYGTWGDISIPVNPTIDVTP